MSELNPNPQTKKPSLILKLIKGFLSAIFPHFMAQWPIVFLFSVLGTVQNWVKFI